MNAIKVRLVITPNGNGSAVYLDGQELKNVRSVTLGKVSVDSLTTLTVEFVNVEAEVEGSVGAVFRRVQTFSVWRRWWAWLCRDELDITRLDAVAREFRKP